jgi:hypothetical protein
MRRPALVSVLAGAAVLALGAAGGPATSERYAYSTYREISGRLTLLVDGFLAGLHDEDRYVPVAVVVGLLGPGPSVSVTPESFALLDESGKEHSAVPYEELLRRYPKRQFDESASRSHPIVVGDQFSMSLQLAGDFYPAPMGKGTRVDRVELAPYTWFHALLYFPRPEGGLDDVLTLRMGGAGIEPPLQVRFRIPRIEPGSPPPAR